MKGKEKLIQRLLEILPGFISWNLILFPYWGIFVIPNVVAYAILIFNLYWFYQSLQIALTSTLSHMRIQASMKYDWMADVKSFPDWKRLRHVVIIPRVNEPLRIMRRTLDSLACQDFPLSQMIIVIAQEAGVDKKHKEDEIKILKTEYIKKFGRFIVTFHTLAPGEIVGKSSNERYSAIEIYKKLVEKEKMDINYLTVTSCDSDHKFYPKHFSCLAFKFMDNPSRYKYFWQAVVMFYNNIWEIPAITRVPNTLMTIWNLSQLPRRDRLISAQNYSLSFKLLHEAGYWDPDKVPEDWGIFFKALYETGGGVEVEPIYLPVHADAAQSDSFWKTLKSQYKQLSRWAYGASDIPWWIKNYFSKKNVPFWDKTTRLWYALWSHILWPVNWFVITIGLTLPTLINPAFGRTALGYTVPKVSSFVLTIALSFLAVMIVYDNIYKPKRPEGFPLWRAMLIPFEFILMPISGFFFSALPGLDAHTRLMLGKYIEHRVTEKV